MATLLLAACAGQQAKQPPLSAPSQTQTPSHPGRKPWKPLGPYTAGGLYAPGVSDGAPEVPPDIANLPEPVPHAEPLAHYGNRSPYVVLGKTYSVLPSAAGYDERGMASWYGTKFDGRVTSSLEPYDLSQFSAAHRTLPLPSYARVTNLENGRSVIVRINDRGPFHEGRLIDLSYAAAIKLGVNVHGTAMVEVRGIDTRQMPSPQSDSVAAKPAPARPAPAIPKRPAPKSDPLAKAFVPSTPVATSAENDASPAESPTNDLSPLPDATPHATKSDTGTTQSDTHVIVAPAAPSPILPSPSSIATPSPHDVVSAGPAPASAATTTTATTPAPAPVGTIPAATSSVANIPAIANPPAPQLGHLSIDPSTPGFLQVASYGDRANAERMMQRLQQAGVAHVELVSVQVADQTLWRVHVGPMRADEAATVAAHLDALGFGTPPFFKE